MQKQDKIDIAREALDKLAEAEELLRQLDDSYLNGYVVGHINAQGTYLGDGLYQNVEDYIKETEETE
jgi:hypothetical protein